MPEFSQYDGLDLRSTNLTEKEGQIHAQDVDPTDVYDGNIGSIQPEKPATLELDPGVDPAIYLHCMGDCALCLLSAEKPTMRNPFTKDCAIGLNQAAQVPERISYAA